MAIEISQNAKELAAVKLYYAVQECLILTLAPGETGGNYKLSIRARLDPNTASMCDASGVENNGKVTFILNTFTQEFKRVCNAANTLEASANSTLVWLEIYDETASHVLVQGQIQIGCRAATLNGQPSAPVESYLKNPTGGTAGQVLTKTANGTKWADGSGTAQTQTDWNQSDNTAVDFIKNKPVIPAAQTQADWNQSDNTAVDFIKNKPVIPDITVGPCISLGQIVGTGTMTLSWADPADVTLDGATLTSWVKTILVRKLGSYPSAWNDGTTIAQTVRADGTKNRYRDTGFTDTPSGTGTNFYGLFSLSSAGVWNNLTANLYPQGITSYSWYNIQAFVRAGTASQKWPVGTVFTVPHAEYSHSDGTGLKFRVVGYDLMQAQDQSLTHTMLLDMVDCLFTTPYDGVEFAYFLTADTIAITGKIYYTLSGTTYTALVEGTDWNPGDTVPVASWYEKNARSDSGSNNPVQSNVIQWLNSSGAANSWFTKQNLWDTCTGTLLSKNGFCRNIDSSFLSVVAAATLKTQQDDYDGGGIVTHYAKFFPLCLNQMSSQITGENTYIPYYSSNDLRKKTLFDNTSCVEYWLRTAKNNGLRLFSIASDGSYSLYKAGAKAEEPYGISPACIIA